MEIATIAITALTPYFIKGAEAFAQKVGGNTAEKVGELYQAIKKKFRGDSKAEAILTLVEENPNSNGLQSSLKEVIDEKMKEDSQFAEDLRQLTKEMQLTYSLDTITRGNQNIAINRGFGNGDIKIGNIKIETHLDKSDLTDSSTREELIASYKDQICHSPDQAQFPMALGLYYLDREMYFDAKNSLSEAQKIAPKDAAILYYLALANIGGRNPRNLKLSEINKIENYLRGAINNDSSKAHYFYIWSIIKYYYYKIQCIRSNPPKLEELLEAAAQAIYVQEEFDRMLRLVPIPKSDLRDKIQECINVYKK
jgi:hypothetical protein